VSASAGDTGVEVGRVGKARILAVSGIVVPVVQQFETARKVASNVGGLTFQKLLELLVGYANAGADYVFLIFGGELTTGYQQEGSGIPRRFVAWPHAETKEPNIEIFLQFRRLPFVEAVMCNKRDMDQPERVLEDYSYFLFKGIFLDTYNRLVFHDQILSGSWTG
jgi:hypothetical protein